MKSTGVFHQQMVKAFSDVAEGELRWFSDLADGIGRVGTLVDGADPEWLTRQLRHRDTACPRNVPFQCFRGHESLQVTDFRRFGSLGLDFGWDHRLTVRKLAAYRGHEAFRDFVYLDTKVRFTSFTNFFLAAQFSAYNDTDYQRGKAMRKELDLLAAGDKSLESLLPRLLELPRHPVDQKNADY